MPMSIVETNGGSIKINLPEEQRFYIEETNDGNLFLVESVEIATSPGLVCHNQICFNGCIANSSAKRFIENQTLVMDLETNCIWDNHNT